MIGTITEFSKEDVECIERNARDTGDVLMTVRNFMFETGRQSITEQELAVFGGMAKNVLDGRDAISPKGFSQTILR